MARSSQTEVNRDRFWRKSCARERADAAQNEARAAEWRATCLAAGVPPESLPPESPRAAELTRGGVSRTVAYKPASRAYGALARGGYISLLPRDGLSFIREESCMSARSRDPELLATLPASKSEPGSARR